MLSVSSDPLRPPLFEASDPGDVDDCDIRVGLWTESKENEIKK